MQVLRTALPASTSRSPAPVGATARSVAARGQGQAPTGCNQSPLVELVARGHRPVPCAREGFRRGCGHESSEEPQTLGLAFFVSRDEEYVRLYAICGRRALDLGSRAHNYLLLTLARRRVSDTADGLPVTARGWIHHDEIAHDPSMAPPRLDLNVFRLRRQFASHGLASNANLIERRASTRQIRLGIDRVGIWPL
jgi:hypothetical protein